MFKQILATSEFWVAVFKLIGSILAAFAVIDPAQWESISQFAIPYILFRLTGKLAKAIVKPVDPADVANVARGGAAALVLGLGLMLAVPAHAAPSKLVMPKFAVSGGWSVDARRLDSSYGFWMAKATWQPYRHVFIGPRWRHEAGRAGRIEAEASFVF